VSYTDDGQGNLVPDIVITSPEDGDEIVFTNRLITSLTVKKTIGGDLGDRTKRFSFTAKFTNADGTPYTSALTAPSSSDWAAGAEAGVYTFKLGHDEEITIANIPAGIRYEVSEDAEDYEATVKTGGGEAVSGTSASGTLAEDTALEFENVKNGEIPTGVAAMDRVLYLAGLFVVLMLAAALLFLRKRNA
jgi:fibronectin-binding protein 1